MLIFFIFICQVLIIESVYQVLYRSIAMAPGTKQRFKNLYFMVRSFSVMLMLLGVGVSIQRVLKQEKQIENLSPFTPSGMDERFKMLAKGKVAHANSMASNISLYQMDTKLMGTDDL